MGWWDKCGKKTHLYQVVVVSKRGLGAAQKKRKQVRLTIEICVQASN